MRHFLLQNGCRNCKVCFQSLDELIVMVTNESNQIKVIHVFNQFFVGSISWRRCN